MQGEILIQIQWNFHANLTFSQDMLNCCNATWRKKVKTPVFTVLCSSLAEWNHEQSCVFLAPNVNIQKYSLGTLGSSMFFFVTVKNSPIACVMNCCIELTWQRCDSIQWVKHNWVLTSISETKLNLKFSWTFTFIFLILTERSFRSGGNNATNVFRKGKAHSVNLDQT